MDELAPPQDQAPPSTRGFWIGFVLGAPLIGLGIRGVLINSDATHPAELGRWITGSAIVHDAVVLPIVATIGFVAHRYVATWAWPAVRWALMTTAILLVVSRPFVARYGANPDNPTALNRNYGLGVTIAVGVTWITAGAWALLHRTNVAHRPTRPSPPIP